MVESMPLWQLTLPQGKFSGVGMARARNAFFKGIDGSEARKKA
jgi:hypothetical protein